MKRLIEDWEAQYPNSPHLRFLKTYHLAFCTELATRVLQLDKSIMLDVKSDEFYFYDSRERIFFSVSPQKEAVVLAPLTVSAKSLETLGIAFRDIRGKKYRMGGEVRVYLSGIPDEIENAVQLAHGL